MTIAYYAVHNRAIVSVWFSFITSICCSIFYIWSADLLCHKFALCLAHSKGMATPKSCTSPTGPDGSTVQLNEIIKRLDHVEKFLLRAPALEVFVSWCLLSSGAKISALGGHSKRLTLFSFLSCRHHWSTWRRKEFLQNLYMSSLHLWHKLAKTRNCIVNTQAQLPASSTRGGFMAAFDADMKWSCSVWQKAMLRPRLSSVLMFLTARL